MVDLTESLKLKDQTYLPFLELLRKIGIFPCKTVRNEESGEITLVPTNGKLQLLLYCIVSSILSAASVMTFILIQSSSGTNLNYLDFVIEYWKAGSGLQHSKFDLNIQGFFFLFLSIIHIVIQISLAAAKQDLCEVLNYLKLHGFLRDNPMTNCVKKSCDWHLIKMGFWAFSFIIYLIGFAVKIIYHFNLSILTYLPHLTCWFLQNVWFLAPILSFHIYFMEISVMLLPWTWSLKEKLKESPSNTLLEEAEKILSSLQMISKAISKIIFWLFTLILVATIFCTYLMVAFFLNQQEFTVSVILTILGYGGMVSLYVRFAYGYCVFTQDIKDDIHGIKVAILDLDIHPDDLWTSNGKTLRVKHWQKRIASGLAEFQGFHGNNYFVLGKPLLTSITANFITYLIILVQFKVSELSVK